MATPTDGNTTRFHGATHSESAPTSTTPKHEKPDVSEQTAAIIQLFKANVRSGEGAGSYRDAQIWRTALSELLKLPTSLSKEQREKIKNCIETTNDPQIVCFAYEDLIDKGIKIDEGNKKSLFALSSEEYSQLGRDKRLPLKEFLDNCQMGR